MTATATTTLPLPEKPVLGYKYEFKPYQIDEIVACNEAHGFAVVKGFLPGDWVVDLKRSIDEVLNPNKDLKPGETRFQTTFVEESEPLQRLLDYQPYMELFYSMLGTREVTLNRSAAILKSPGAPFGMWHTDWVKRQENPTQSNQVLNSGEWPSGFWFYLNGTHPSRGGLGLIEDSHFADWPGPEGFVLTPDRKTFCKKGQEEKGGYCNFDVPGMIPLYTDPGDLIIFAARTYHGVFEHKGTENRYSCAVGFRPKSQKLNAPWPMPDAAKKFVANAPARWKGMLEEYTSLSRTWDRSAKY
jgi:ectoine hydroxylase-related dioxygenase (phytanoyl-CoA dioxygenase family)